MPGPPIDADAADAVALDDEEAGGKPTTAAAAEEGTAEAGMPMAAVGEGRSTVMCARRESAVVPPPEAEAPEPFPPTTDAPP